jgi:hypothetical protein
MKIIIRHILAFILYWICIIVVPYLLLLWNDISKFLIIGIDKGSLMWYVFSIMLQPAAVVIASVVTVTVAPTHKHVWVIINSVLCVCLLSVLLLFCILDMAIYSWDAVASFTLSIIAVIVVLIKYKDIEKETDDKTTVKDETAIQ